MNLLGIAEPTTQPEKMLGLGLFVLLTIRPAFFSALFNASKAERSYS